MGGESPKGGQGGPQKNEGEDKHSEDFSKGTQTSFYPKDTQSPSDFGKNGLAEKKAGNLNPKML